jgi:hypothetical protein
MTTYRSALLAVLLAASGPASAATVTHSFDFSLTFQELREESPYYGVFNWVRDVPWELYYQDTDGSWVSTGGGTLDDYGSFGSTVMSYTGHQPDTATWRLELTFDDLYMKVVDHLGSTVGVGGTYTIVYTAVAAGDGATADFGDHYWDPSTDRDWHGVAQLWVAYADFREDWQNHPFIAPYVPSAVSPGGWWRIIYPQLTLKWSYNDPDTGWSQTNGNTIRMSPDHVNPTSTSVFKTRTFYHELGHFSAGNDATSSSGPISDVCAYSSSSWPWSELPYTYTDPYDDPTTPECWKHSWQSYEADPRAFREGAADFFAAVMLGGSTCDNSSEDFEYVPLNFDGSHREHNVTGALCDLLDPDYEETSVKHLYADSTSGQVLFSGATSSASLVSLAMNDTHAFAQPDVYTITMIDLASGAESTHLNLTSPKVFAALSADGNQLCRATLSSIWCEDLTAAQETEITNAPSGIRDIEVRDGDLYVLYETGGVWYIDSATISTTSTTASYTWSTIYSEPDPSDDADQLRDIAVDPGTQLYMSRAYRVSSCTLTSCATSLTWAGDATGVYGYRRGNRSNTLLGTSGGVQELVHRAGYLYIIDGFGVSRGNTATGSNLEQHVGVGPDDIFHNNLAPRSLVIEPAATPQLLFATNGDLLGDTLIEAPITYLIDDTRQGGSDQTDYARYLWNNPTVTEETYCPSEFIAGSSVDGIDLMHPYIGEDDAATFNTLLGAMPSVNAWEADAVRAMNWIDLYDDPECIWDTSEVVCGDDDPDEDCI